jgi:uncharacterized membrane protein
MLAYLGAYLASGLAFIAADFGWLTVTGPRLYRPVLGPLLADRVNGAAAVAFYLIYLAGVQVLAVSPSLREGDLRSAALRGLVLGLVAYGTYDLTNQATLRAWATRLTVADMLWGGLLTAFAASVGFLAAQRLAAP